MKWLHDLRKSMLTNEDVIPPGWLSVDLAAKELKVSNWIAGEIMRKGFRRGELEKRKFRVLVGSRCKRIDFYKKK